jgi:hypothetical protein
MSEDSRLRVDRSLRDDVMLVEPQGVLDLGTYADLRDALIKCALEQPTALVVDLSALWVPTEATLSVFSTVWMRVSDWPGVPIALITSYPEDQERLRRSAVSRFVPVHATFEQACQALHEPPLRRRTVVELPNSNGSPAVARWFVGETCLRWECTDLLPAAIMVANELVENAIRHASGEPRLRLELHRDTLTVAVYDHDPTPVRWPDGELHGPEHLGLRLVTEVATACDCAPLWSGGKVVWAVLRPVMTG